MNRPEDRSESLHEIAAILAVGFIRLHAQSCPQVNDDVVTAHDSVDYALIPLDNDASRSDVLMAKLARNSLQ